MEAIERILTVCRNIKHDRTVDSVVGHMRGEIVELMEEVSNVKHGIPEGDDGVLGESCDVILTLVDLVYKINPSITAEDFEATIAKKLEKWERVYG